MKMEADHTKKGFSQLAKNYKEIADDIQVHVDNMKEVLYASQKSM